MWCVYACTFMCVYWYVCVCEHIYVCTCVCVFLYTGISECLYLKNISKCVFCNLLFDGFVCLFVVCFLISSTCQILLNFFSFDNIFISRWLGRHQCSGVIGESWKGAALLPLLRTYGQYQILNLGPLCKSQQVAIPVASHPHAEQTLHPSRRYCLSCVRCSAFWVCLF